MQQRACHTHGFMWVKDMPDLQILIKTAQEGFEE